jgi:hypothetical protein
MPVTAGGCAAVAWTAAQFAQPKQVDALYKIPQGKKILVFADDIMAEVSYQPVKAMLAEETSFQLVAHKLAAETVPYERLIALTREKGFDKLSVGEVGAKLGADVVLYVHIDKFSLKDTPDTPLWRGQLHATIRVVDVKAGRLWPQDKPEGFPVPPVDLPTVEDSSQVYATQLAKELATKMADRIAKCFYDHKVPAQEYYK